MRDLIGSIGFAALLSHEAALILLFGLLGWTGNSYVTAGAMLLCFGLILTAGKLEIQRPTLLDWLFFGLLFSVAASLNRSFEHADFREIALLVFSLMAYPIVRAIEPEMLSQIHRACRVASLVVVAVGVVLTIFALAHQWNDAHGKPLIFGFDHAVVVYAISLSVLILSCACIEPVGWQRIAVYGLIGIAAIVLGMSLVRGVFIATAIALFIAALANRDKKVRRRLYLANLFFCALVLSGFYSRNQQAMQLTSYVFQENIYLKGKGGVAAKELPPSCRTKIDMRNSIAIRKALIRDALYFVPKAGPFGIGLSGFNDESCIKGYEVHNVTLQTLIEFGWIGGACLIALLLVSMWSLIVPSIKNTDIRFLLCALLFFFLVNSMYGRVSRAIILFSFVGLAASIQKQLLPKTA